MNRQKILDRLLIDLPLRLLKRNILRNVMKRQANGPRALVYFKTTPYFSRRLRNAYVHTNNAEIVELVSILDRHGFVVDLVDRAASMEEILPLQSFRYDLYLGNAAGNSAKYHAWFLNNLNATTNILFAAGPDPETSNKLVSQRHADFEARTGVLCEHRRMVRGEDFAERFIGVDAIFYVGNDFSRSSYSRHGIPMYRVYPSSCPTLSFEVRALQSKDPSRFMYIGGNGLICKGLDLVLEAFSELSEYRLDVCAPETEQDVMAHYAPLLEKCDNIHFHGFVPLRGAFFHELARLAGYQIFPGSAEGTATSVVAGMRMGVVPVVTAESGIDLGEYGCALSAGDISSIVEVVPALANVSRDELKRRVLGTYSASMKYTLEGFSHSFERALLNVLHAG